MNKSEHVSNAIALIKVGEYDEAIETLQAPLRQYQGREATYATLAYCYEKKSSFSKAIYLYTCALDIVSKKHDASSEKLKQSWQKHLAECERNRENEVKVFDVVVKGCQYEKIAWVTCACSIFMTFLTIPLVFDVIFDVLIESSMVSFVFFLISLIASMYGYYCLRQRKKQSNAVALAVGDDYLSISNKCPACELNYRTGVIECPWCGYEKEIELAEKYAEEGNYSRAYDCLREFYHHPDAEIRHRVKPLCSEYLSYIKEKESASREADLERTAQMHIAMARTKMEQGNYMESLQTLRKIDARAASYSEVEKLIEAVEGVISQASEKSGSRQNLSVRNLKRPLLVSFTGKDREFRKPDSGTLQSDEEGLVFIGSSGTFHVSFATIRTFRLRKGDRIQVTNDTRQTAAAIGVGISFLGALMGEDRLGRSVGRAVSHSGSRGESVRLKNVINVILQTPPDDEERCLQFVVEREDPAESESMAEAACNQYKNELTKYRQLKKEERAREKAENRKKNNQLKAQEAGNGHRSAIVLGCPKCQTKIRVRACGIIQCPRCQSKVRVSEQHFTKGIKA